MRRSLGQFTPAYWDKDEWNPLQGPVRFVEVLGLAVLILIVEVNAFFLKFCLWIPPLNPLNSYRLLIWWLIANPAIREWNTFIQTRLAVPSLFICGMQHPLGKIKPAHLLYWVTWCTIADISSSLYDVWTTEVKCLFVNLREVYVYVYVYVDIVYYCDNSLTFVIFHYRLQEAH